MSDLVLSLFPGIGLLDMAFEAEGFCVVRGPDLLWGGDVKRFHPPAGRFDGVIGGPPCQAHSPMSRIARARGHRVAEDLIPEFERVVGEAQPDWFLMENVPQAPVAKVAGYLVEPLILNNRWCQETPGSGFGPAQNRGRQFSFGSRDGRKLLPRMAALENPSWEPAVLANNSRAVAVLLGGNGKVKKTAAGGYARNAIQRSRRSWAEVLRLQGLPEDFDLPPFKVMAKQRAIGNGVPYPLARTVACAVREANEIEAARAAKEMARE